MGIIARWEQDDLQMDQIGHLQQKGETLQAEASACHKSLADVVRPPSEVAELREHDGHIVGARYRDHLCQPLLLPGRPRACSTAQLSVPCKLVNSACKAQCQ